MNDTLPRVSELIKFLYEDELESIPRQQLYKASEYGTAMHRLIEENHNSTLYHPIMFLWHEGVKILKPKGKPLFEGSIKGKRYRGTPDCHYDDWLIDNKFTRGDLRPVTALQLIAYHKLIIEKYGKDIPNLCAFHYPSGESGMFIQKVPDATKPILNEFLQYIIENKESIDDGRLELYEAFNRWDRIQIEYTLFELVDAVFLPLSITSPHEAEKAVRLYRAFGEIEKQKEYLKSELKRYMKENDITSLEYADGSGVRLQKGRNYPAYNIPEEVKEKYKTGTKQAEPSLVPYKKKLKQVKQLPVNKTCE